MKTNMHLSGAESGAVKRFARKLLVTSKPAYLLLKRKQRLSSKLLRQSSSGY